MKYAGHLDGRNRFGRKLEVRQEWNGLAAVSHLQFYDGLPVVRSWTTLENHSDAPFGLEHLSSFCLTGLTKSDPRPRDIHGTVHIPHSTWFGECQWKAYTLRELGYDAVNDFSMKRVALSSTGTWPASEHLPMGGWEDGGSAMVWQIETAGSWGWEVSDIAGQLYLQAHGPSYAEHQFFKIISPGEAFEGVPCAAACVNGDFQDGVRALTKYRRSIRRPNADNLHPNVIFNDYMNCLMGDPTTEKLLPLIDAAAEAGCKYFCIDAGWYSDGPWWDGVGEWLPSRARFPGGIGEPLRRIRERGMIPGLWLELEVMGVRCPAGGGGAEGLVLSAERRAGDRPWPLPTGFPEPGGPRPRRPCGGPPGERVRRGLHQDGLQHPGGTGDAAERGFRRGRPPRPTPARTLRGWTKCLSVTPIS